MSDFLVKNTNEIQRLMNEVKKRDDEMLKVQTTNSISRLLNEKYKERESKFHLRIFALISKQ